LEPALRDGLGSQQIARLTTAVAASLHEVYLVVALIAALTLAVSLFYPPGLSPTRPAERPPLARKSQSPGFSGDDNAASGESA
jgi:hypothetical protein